MHYPTIPPLQVQVHIFVFTVAIVHVVMGCLMVLLGNWRLGVWRRMCADEDEHSRRVRSFLDGSGVGASSRKLGGAASWWMKRAGSRGARSPSASSRWARLASMIRGRSRSDHGGDMGSMFAASSPTAAAAAAVAAAKGGAAGAQPPAASTKPPLRSQSAPRIIGGGGGAREAAAAERQHAVELALQADGAGGSRPAASLPGQDDVEHLANGGQPASSRPNVPLQSVDEDRSIPRPAQQQGASPGQPPPPPRPSSPPNRLSKFLQRCACGGGRMG